MRKNLQETTEKVQDLQLQKHQTPNTSLPEDLYPTLWNETGLLPKSSGRWLKPQLLESNTLRLSSSMIANHDLGQNN